MPQAVNQSLGRLIASVLAGSWRRSRTAFEHSPEELERVTPALLRSGTAALGWWRVCHSELKTTPAANELHQAYRLYTLRAIINQQAIERAVALLRSEGIEPILVKGWAAAHLYPEHGLRPYGDIDLCVRPAQHDAAATVLRRLGQEQHKVDLHRGFEKFGGGSAEAIYARSRLIKLGETDVRVPCPEDHLRVLSIHLLREGAWRPLWLCDVAAAVESAGSGFDWDCCLTEVRRQADWVNCAIRVAQDLLGADIGDDTPATRRTNPLPRWLIPTVLKEWASRLPSMQERHRAPMASYLSRPAGILKGLRHRWPNTIEATVVVRGPFNDWPRLPFQLGSYVARTVKFAARLPKSRR